MNCGTDTAKKAVSSRFFQLGVADVFIESAVEIGSVAPSPYTARGRPEGTLGKHPKVLSRNHLLLSISDYK